MGEKSNRSRSALKNQPRLALVQPNEFNIVLPPSARRVARCCRTRGRSAGSRLESRMMGVRPTSPGRQQRPCFRVELQVRVAVGGPGRLAGDLVDAADGFLSSRRQWPSGSARSARARVGGDMISAPFSCFLVGKMCTRGARFAWTSAGHNNGKRTALKPSTVENSL
jgi:hypothetical protein